MAGVDRGTRRGGSGDVAGQGRSCSESLGQSLSFYLEQEGKSLEGLEDLVFLRRERPGLLCGIVCPGVGQAWQQKHPLGGILNSLVIDTGGVASMVARGVESPQIWIQAVDRIHCCFGGL